MRDQFVVECGLALVPYISITRLDTYKTHMQRTQHMTSCLWLGNNILSNNHFSNRDTSRVQVYVADSRNLLQMMMPMHGLLQLRWGNSWRVTKYQNHEKILCLWNKQLPSKQFESALQANVIYKGSREKRFGTLSINSIVVGDTIDCVHIVSTPELWHSDSTCAHSHSMIIMSCELFYQADSLTTPCINDTTQLLTPQKGDMKVKKIFQVINYFELQPV